MTKAVRFSGKVDFAYLDKNTRNKIEGLKNTLSK